ncbi:MAG TPA: DUF2460 domain-containing protein, partial [Sunxiuqinia sp.]|nr:DUF2460 domain-containing protein [Sunxiuqinia sp.]
MATFPDDPVTNYPLVVEPQWRTQITEVDSGGEQRKQKSLFPRYNVRVNFKLMTNAQIQAIWEFYQARKGAYESFYIYDLISLTHDAQYVGTADGATLILDLPGKSTSSQTIYSNGIELTEGYDYDILTGGGDSDADRVDFGTDIFGGTYDLGILFKWNRSDSWEISAGELSSQTQILSLVVLNGEIYGGTYPDGKLFKWDGISAWEEVAGQLSSQTQILSLVVLNGEIYGGTYPDGKLFKWDGMS